MHADISRPISIASTNEREGARDFAKALYLFPAAVTLHHLEELIYLPGWSQTAGRLHEPVGTFAFGFAAVVVTAIAWAVTNRAARQPRESASLYVAMGFVTAMLLHAFVPHVLVMNATGEYAPGIATALGVTLPVGGYLLWRAFREGNISFRRFALITPAVVLCLAGLMPILSAVGKFLG